LVKVPLRSDVTSVWAGLRPLARTDEKSNEQGATQNVSREHTVKVAANGMVSVMGGKWTTYRAMAADVMQSIRNAQLISLTSEDATLDTKLWGAPSFEPTKVMQKDGASVSGSPYGTDAELLASLPGASICCRTSSSRTEAARSDSTANRNSAGAPSSISTSIIFIKINLNLGPTGLPRRY
jgi:glycerol-3-phosphate dehydrogenase